MKAELSYRLLVTLLFASEQQWGYTTAQSGTITFPLAFASACYTITHGTRYGSPSTSDHTGNVGSVSTTSFKFATVSGGFGWMAVGK